MQVISTESAPKALGPYSQAISAGDFLYCSGQIPIDPTTGEVVAGSMTLASEQVLTNLSAVLRAGSCTLSDVVKTTVFLTDMNDFAEMNSVYERYFGDHKPARSTVAVAALPKGVTIEIECIAQRN